MPTTLMNVAAKSAAGPDSKVRQVIDRAPQLPTNVGEMERLASVAAGGFLVARSLLTSRPSLLGALAGSACVFRGVSGNCAVYRALGHSTAQAGSDESVMKAGQGERVDVNVTINRPVEVVYRFWRQLENLPRFMTHLLEVKDLGDNRSHWVAKGPLGLKVEWDATIITDVPNETIGWKSTDNADVDTAGSVRFRPSASGDGTDVQVSLKFNPPAGKVGALIARIMGLDPQDQIHADLLRLKHLFENGQGRS